MEPQVIAAALTLVGVLAAAALTHFRWRGERDEKRRAREASAAEKIDNREFEAYQDVYNKTTEIYLSLRSSSAAPDGKEFYAKLKELTEVLHRNAIYNSHSAWSACIDYVFAARALGQALMRQRDRAEKMAAFLQEQSSESVDQQPPRTTRDRDYEQAPSRERYKGDDGTAGDLNMIEYLLDEGDERKRNKMRELAELWTTSVEIDVSGVQGLSALSEQHEAARKRFLGEMGEILLR